MIERKRMAALFGLVAIAILLGHILDPRSRHVFQAVGHAVSANQQNVPAFLSP